MWSPAQALLANPLPPEDWSLFHDLSGGQGLICSTNQWSGVHVSLQVPASLAWPASLILQTFNDDPPSNGFAE